MLFSIVYIRPKILFTPAHIRLIFYFTMLFNGNFRQRTCKVECGKQTKISTLNKFLLQPRV